MQSQIQVGALGILIVPNFYSPSEDNMLPTFFFSLIIIAYYLKCVENIFSFLFIRFALLKTCCMDKVKTIKT